MNLLVIAPFPESTIVPLPDKKHVFEKSVQGIIITPGAKHMFTYYEKRVLKNITHASKPTNQSGMKTFSSIRRVWSSLKSLATEH